MAEKLLTQDDFLLQTGISRTLQWKLRDSGYLSFYQINGRIKYSQRHIDEYLKRCERNIRENWTLLEIIESTGLSSNFLNMKIEEGKLITSCIDELIVVKRSDLNDFLNQRDVSNQINQVNQI